MVHNALIAQLKCLIYLDAGNNTTYIQGKVKKERFCQLGSDYVTCLLLLLILSCARRGL